MNRKYSSLLPRNYGLSSRLYVLFPSSGHVMFYSKIHCLTSELHVKFHFFRVKFNVVFTRQAVNFSCFA